MAKEKYNSSEIAIGIDLGGTTLKSGVITKSGDLLNSFTEDTPHQFTVDDFIKKVDEIINKFSKITNNNRQSLKIGIGVPSLVTKDKTIINAPNLNWQDVKLEKKIKEKLNLSVHIEHDVKCGCIAEKLSGAGKKKDDFVYLTIGTGIGAAIIINGKIRRGYNGCAGNLGHWVIDPEGNLCNCGLNGCLERYVASPAIVRNAKIEIQKGKYYGIEKKELSAKYIFENIDKIEAAKNIVDQVAIKLGLVFSRIITILDPGLIIIGGGIGQADKYFYKKINTVIKNNVECCFAQDTQAVPALLEESVLIGAGLFAFKKIREEYFRFQ